MQTTTDQPEPTTPTDQQIEALERQLASANERIANLCDRSGPKFLGETDIDLAGWLAMAAARHPHSLLLEEVVEPLRWPAAARRQLENLIEKHHGCDLQGDKPSRAEELQIDAQIHALCEANGCSPALPDAIILDDDREWRRRHAPAEAR